VGGGDEWCGVGGGGGGGGGLKSGKVVGVLQVNAVLKIEDSPKVASVCRWGGKKFGGKPKRIH